MSFPGYYLDTKTLDKTPYFGEDHRNFIEAPEYPLDSTNPSITVNGVTFNATYAVPMWDFVVNNIFPRLSREEFEAEQNRVTSISSDAKTIHERIFTQMLEDFYESLILGRDDTITDLTATLSQFDNLSTDEKHICFQSYLTTRFHGTNEPEIARRDLRNLEYRAYNMRIWVSFILLKSLEEIQHHTVNSGRLATRYAQTSQSISEEMVDGRYKYRPLVNSEDFIGQHRNQTNAKLLEDLKTYRLITQKRVDRASTDLTKINNDAEIFANFINKLFETDLNIVRGLFA
ncbi:hypothetical protein [Candidatus Similichlamydia epinepheli]|uniref:hypothetical protein n=1 Tax=Candidatus Similichlamydia epinepheli TaxID=1903953 RepID=UPI000D38C4AA|nr:hypothetical protein [Candidatus Similichlamydia epinepheli]